MKSILPLEAEENGPRSFHASIEEEIDDTSKQEMLIIIDD